MTDIATLEEKVAAAKAAAAGKPKGSPEWEAAVQAVRELAAAKKAAADEPSAERLEDLARKAREAQAAREAAQRQEAAVKAAIRAYERAMEWPRCGDGWGTYPGEARHAAVLAKAGIRVDELEVYS